VTHASVIGPQWMPHWQTDAAEVLVGDAPIQGCDFNALIQTTGLDAGRASGWLRNSLQRRARFSQDHLRAGAWRPRRRGEYPVGRSFHALRLDVKACSNRSATTGAGFGWRGTTTASWRRRIIGRASVSVAKEVVDADVHHQSSKLKTHKKAGVTCALQEPDWD